MKREHLIIIAVVIFVLVACGFGVLGAVVLWPTDVPETPPLPDRPADNPGPYVPPIGGGGDSAYYVAVLGTWQCTEASPNIRAGSTLTFVDAPDDASRFAYWAPDAKSKPLIEFRYSLYLQDSFNCMLEQTNAPADQQPVKLKVLVDVLDENKMELFAFDEHRASSQPAILKRVK